MALGYQNPFYLKQAQKKQQSLYDGKVLLAKHDPPVVHDSEETLQLAQESREKMKQMNKEIKPSNYTEINHLSGVFVPQTALSREELYFSNYSKTVNVSKLFSIPNEDLSDDTTPSVAPKFVGDFKSLTKEADDSLAKHKALELEIKRLLKVVKIERLHAQLGDLKGKSKDTSSVSDTRNPLSQNLKNENVELEFQVLNYARENAQLKATYKNLFDSISVSRVDNLRPEDHSLGAIQSMIGSPLRLRVVEARIKKLKLFDPEGKLVASSKSESQSDCSNGDNACTSNAMEPKIKRFPNSTSLLGRLSRFVCGASTQ
nr:hypothetical protein [Tanacetum cinerariifolium]